MIYISFCVVFAIVTATVARAKGSSWLLWGLLGGVFPVLALAGVVLMRREDEELRRTCENCGKVCMLYDAICTRCGNELDFPEVAIESTADAARRAQPTA